MILKVSNSLQASIIILCTHNYNYILVAELIDLKGQSMLTHTCIGGHLEFIVNLIEKHGFSPDGELS